LSYFNSKTIRNFGFLIRSGKTQNPMRSLGRSCCLCKHKSKYKRKINKNSLLNNLHSQSETSNLECDFFPKTNLFSIRSFWLGM